MPSEPEKMTGNCQSLAVICHTEPVILILSNVLDISKNITHLSFGRSQSKFEKNHGLYR